MKAANGLQSGIVVTVREVRLGEAIRATPPGPGRAHHCQRRGTSVLQLSESDDPWPWTVLGPASVPTGPGDTERCPQTVAHQEGLAAAVGAGKTSETLHQLFGIGAGSRKRLVGQMPVAISSQRRGREQELPHDASHIVDTPFPQGARK